jgi:Short C-terminal domain
MPLMRRRPLLRAAATAGGAYLAGKHRANKQAEQREDAYVAGQQSTAAAAAPAPAAAPAAPAASSGITEADTARLGELGKLHDQGILTDEEFAQQKARILGTA